MTEERLLNIYGANVSVFSDGSVWVHRGPRNKRRFGDLSDKGYRRIQIRDNGVSRTVFVHRLVAEAFVPNPHGKPDINHINGNKSDNRPENLEWCTNEENLRHRYDILKHYHKNRKAVICVETGEQFPSTLDASKSTGICRCNIGMCINHKRKTAGGYHWEVV